MQNESHVWRSFTSFQSTSFVQTFLYEAYTQQSIQNADVKSYDNCYAFIYYLEHGKKYYQLAQMAPNEIKPMLLFYGMVQLIKACILTVDPDYPATTAVLAHGVSTRKRKKQNYSFLQDEVKIQKDGLLRHFARSLFSFNILRFDRLSMESLFARIPEMNLLFAYINKNEPSKSVKINDNIIYLQATVLDDLNMTRRRFREFFHDNSVHACSFEENDTVIFHEDAQLTPLQCAPFFFHRNGQYYLPTKRDLFHYVHEIIVHYLILYNLSMICRYETEWWNDLFHTFSSNDLPFIQQFLSVTIEKVPFLLSLYLQRWVNE